MKLIYGVEYGGKIHREFELRIPMIGDNIAAVEDAAGGNDLDVNVAVLARCLLVLGEIPKDQITHTFLRSNLVDDDYDVLWAGMKEIKKKRAALNADSSSFDLPS